MREICKGFNKINKSELIRIKYRIQKSSKNKNVYFKDEMVRGKRNLCFRAKPYDKDEVNPYTTNLATIGLRKLNIRVIGIGKLK